MTTQPPRSYTRLALAIIVAAIIIAATIFVTIGAATTVTKTVSEPPTSSSVGTGSCTFSAEGFLLMRVLNSTNGQPVGSLAAQTQALQPACASYPAVKENLGAIDTNASGFLSVSGPYNWTYFAVNVGLRSYSVNASMNAGALTCVTLTLPFGDQNITQACNEANYFGHQMSRTPVEIVSVNLVNATVGSHVVFDVTLKNVGNSTVYYAVYDGRTSPVSASITSSSAISPQSTATGIDCMRTISVVALAPGAVASAETTDCVDSVNYEISSAGVIQAIITVRWWTNASAFLSENPQSISVSQDFSVGSTSAPASSCNGCAPPSFWIDCIDNSTVSVPCKFLITQGASYSASVPINTEIDITFFGNGVISLPTLTCSGSNCPSQTFALYQSEVCTPGALFCPSGDEWTTIDFVTPGSYSLAFSYQTTPGGPQVSNSLTVLAK
jgi:hypothetical protein